jgi:ketosteroid isomerase-like protein
MTLLLVTASCSEATSRRSSGDAAAGIDSLNARLIQAYRGHDVKAYGALYTDSAIFEWPGFTSARGPAAMEEIARGNWAKLRDMDLKLIVASRQLASDDATDHATEFGAFEQSWTDSVGARRTEYGRYVTSLARGGDGRWRIDRFFGFADSTRPSARRP